MDMTKFSAFKYQHDGSGGITAQRWKMAKITLVLALVVGVVFFPVGLLALLVPLAIFLTTPKMLYLGPRYLICGSTIVYFGNVTAMVLDSSSGTLRLESANARSFSLQREKFPTNARKAAKIQNNKQTKFEKISAKLIDRVRKASPEVVLTGIER
jgi:hypothetical protein